MFSVRLGAGALVLAAACGQLLDVDALRGGGVASTSGAGGSDAGGSGAGAAAGGATTSTTAEGGGASGGTAGPGGAGGHGGTGGDGEGTAWTPQEACDAWCAKMDKKGCSTGGMCQNSCLDLLSSSNCAEKGAEMLKCFTNQADGCTLPEYCVPKVGVYNHCANAGGCTPSCEGDPPSCTCATEDCGGKPLTAVCNASSCTCTFEFYFASIGPLKYNCDNQGNNCPGNCCTTKLLY